MRIKNIDLNKPYVEIIPIPRGDQDIIFQAQMVQDYKVFDTVCPEPKAPMILMKGETKNKPNINDRTYKKALKEHATYRTHWMILTSLEATKDLEWDTVDMSKPETWKNYETELREGGFGDVNIVQIINGVMAANGLDESRVEEARERFLALKLESQEQLHSQEDEQESIPSGDVASDSA